MQFDNQKTRNVADVVAKILAGESAKQEPQMLGEELVGNQHKIDANKNKKIDAHDFKMLRAQKDKEKANSQKFGKGVKEETELSESHFKVGDKVKCKESGMDGEITKLDKEDGGEDEKYYTFKREDGKVMKKAPNELSKINEEVDKKKKDLPFTPDATKKPVRNSDGTIQKPMSLARELAKRGLKKAMSKEEVEIDENKKLEAIAKKQLAHIPGKLYKAADGAYYKNHKGKSHISNPAVGSKPSTPRSYSSSNDDDDAVAFQKRDRAGIKLSHDDFIGSGYGGGGGALSYDRKRNRVREEVEQIDELSKDTLKSYAGKVIDKTRTMPQGEKKQKHLVGLVKSMDKMKKEETEIDEAMFPGTKEYEKKYGESPQQKLKKKGDTVPTSQGEMKKTEKGVQHSRRFSEMISAYQEQGLKYISELSVEEQASQEEYEKEVNKAKNKSVGKEKADVAKAYVQAVKNEEYEIIDANEINGVRFATIEERSLTEPEMKKKEEMVKGMKKGMSGFKQRYGDRAKEVMYATATKMAKKD
jgi:hypothetical protein